MLPQIALILVAQTDKFPDTVLLMATPFQNRRTGRRRFATGVGGSSEHRIGCQALCLDSPGPATPQSVLVGDSLTPVSPGLMASCRKVCGRHEGVLIQFRDEGSVLLTSLVRIHILALRPRRAPVNSPGPMKSFPPSPRNIPAATRFVKDLPRR